MRRAVVLVTLAVILIAGGYVELVFRDSWLDITNGYTFWGFEELKGANSGVWEAQMRATGNVPVDLKDRLTAKGQVQAFFHHGFWQPMDTLRAKLMLEELWTTNKAPWRVWQ